MTKKQNPFHQWLGLPAEQNNPDYFQLLGVARNTEDPNAIKKQAHENAKRLLAKLKSVTPRNDREVEVKKKIRARIVDAHDTLTSTEKWAAYLSAGQVKPKKQKEQRSRDVQPEAPANAAPQITADAIPMALPVETTIPTATVPEETLPPIADKPIVEAPVTETAAGEFDDFEIAVPKIRASRRRVKRSWVIPAIIFLTMASGIAGLVTLMWQYDTLFDVVDRRVRQQAALANQPKVADKVDSAESTLDLPSLKNGNPAGGSAAKDPSDAQADPADDSTDPAGDAKDEDDNVSTASEDSTDAPSPEPSSDPEGPKLSTGQFATLRNFAVRTRWALVRQNTPAALEIRKRFVNLLKGEFKGKTADNDSQAELISLKRTMQLTGEMAENLDGFWEQVQSSGAGMAGGQAFEYGDETLALVEGRQDDIVLRVAGRNLTIAYRRLPVQLAIDIGNSGAVASVPRWNLYKATYLSVVPEAGEKWLEKRDACLQAARADGFDLEANRIEAFAADARAGNRTEPELPPVFEETDAGDLDAVPIEVFRQRNGYASPSDLKQPKSKTIIDKLFFTVIEDVDLQSEYLREIVAIAKSAGDLDSICEANLVALNNQVDWDLEKSFFESASRISSRLTRPEQVRDFVVGVFRFLQDAQVRERMPASVRNEAIEFIKLNAQEFNLETYRVALNELSVE